MRCRCSIMILVGMFFLQQGCTTMMDSARNMGHQTKQFLSIKPGGYRDATEEEVDDWTEDVGREGRGNQPMEKDPDTWWRDLFMSEKARSIERNVGID